MKVAMKKKITSRKKNLKKQLAAGALAIILGMFPWVSEPAHAFTYNVRPTGLAPGDPGFPPGNLGNYRDLESLKQAVIENGALTTIYFLNGDNNPPTPYGTDYSLTERLSLGGMSWTFNAASVNYATDTISGYRTGGPAIANFINENKTNNQTQKTLTLREVHIGDFSGRAVATSSNISVPAYNIRMESGTFFDNLGGAISITRGLLEIQNYGSEASTHAPSFIRNAAANGGAVIAYDSEVYIYDADFGRDPRAIGSNGTGGNTAVNDGGAVYISDFSKYSGTSSTRTRHEVVDSRFRYNEAGSRGGAIFMTDADMSVTGSSFGIVDGGAGNLANNGGGIAVVRSAYSTRRNVDVYTSTFSYNDATMYGGAFYGIDMNVLAVDGSGFDHNTATTGGGIYLAQGLGNGTTTLNVRESDVTGGGSTFRSNSVTQLGGAIAMFGGAPGMILNLDNVSFSSNSSTSTLVGNGGGAIYIDQSTAYVGSGTTRSSDPSEARVPGAITFTRNIAGNGGGAIKATNSVVNVGVNGQSVNNRFLSNDAGTYYNGAPNYVTQSHGGGIYLTNGTVNIYQGTVFTRSSTATDQYTHGNRSMYGGAIAVDHTASVNPARSILNVTGASFTFNRANNHGDNDAMFKLGTQGQGGAIWVQDTAATIRNSTFGALNPNEDVGSISSQRYTHQYGNHAIQAGGAIFLGRHNVDAGASSQNSHVISGSEFYRNKAQSAYSNATDGIQTHGNSTYSAGGAIFVSQSCLTLTDSIFQENRAANRGNNPDANVSWKTGGGAIAIYDDQSNAANASFHARLHIGNTRFLSNLAGSDGTDNVDQKQGGGNGGAILAANTLEFSVGNSTFDQNRAIMYHNTAPGANGVIADTGGYGGAITILRNLGNSLALPSSSPHEIATSTFTNNSAEQAGGAISAITLAIGDQSQYHNPATDIMALQVRIDGSGVTGAMFDSNRALKGGAVYGLASIIDVSNTMFSANKAEVIRTVDGRGQGSGLGGAIAMEGGIVQAANPEFLSGFLTLDDSILILNTAKDEGGAIYTMETVNVIRNTTFGDAGDTSSGNRAVRGGAISVHQSHQDPSVADTDDYRQMIDQSHFYANIASNAGATADTVYNDIIRGGAINIEDTVVVLTGSDFAGNKVTTATKSDKLTNWRDIGGGAIAITNNLIGFRTGLEADTLEFSNNSAQGFGGAILSKNATLFSVTASTFDGNKAITFVPANNGTTLGGDGGAMALYKDDKISGTHWIYSSTFTNNAADRDGGAIVATGVWDEILDLRITTTSPGPVVVTEFTGNTAERHGGAANATYVALNVTDTNFQENMAGNAESGSTSQGGAIWIYGGSLNLGDNARDNGVTFTNNIASFQGGAIYVTGGSDTNIVKTRFVENGFAEGADFTTKQGGAIFYNGPATNNGEYHRIALSSFEDNKVSSSASTQNLYGGAIAMTNGAKLRIEGTDFSRNLVSPSTNPAAVFGGGAIGLRGNGTDELAVISGNSGNKRSTFDANEADGHGGAIYVTNAALFTVNAADFTNNAATANIAVNGGHGGAIYVVDSPLSGTNVTNSTFGDNTADKNGGAISTVNSGATNITGTTFTNNQAMTGNGGALDAIGGTTVTLTGSRFGTIGNGNSAANGKGGGVNATNLTGHFISDNTTYTGNTAQVGGGVNLTWDAATTAAHNVRITIPAGTGSDPVFAFNENSATAGDGGGLNIDLGRDATQNIVTTITDASFRNNSASGNGGGIAIKNISEQGATSVLNVNATNKNVLFTGNTAGGKGNDIYLVKTDSFFNASADRTITITGGLQTDSKVDKSGTGTLLIQADSFITYPGTGEADAALTVSEGTLNIGTYENADGEKIGAIVTVTGDTYMREGSTLSASLNDLYAVGIGDKAALYTDHFLLETGGGGARPIITINDFTGGGSPPIENCGTYPGTGGAVFTIVEAKHDINKDDYQFVISGGTGDTITENEFLWYYEVRTDENKNKIQYGAGLVWDMQDPDSAHGTFFIDEGMVFTLNTTLKDNTTGGGGGNKFGWDGTKFTKDGKGMLVLGGVDETEVGRNLYSGDTYVKGGILAVTHSTNGIIDSFKADSVVRISEGATFQVGAYGVGCTSMGDKIINAELVNELVDNGGAGNFAVAAGPGGEVRINRENSYSGLTTIKSGTLKLGNILGMGVNDFDKIVRINEDAELNLALGADAELKKKLEGSGSLRKENSNTVTVTNDNRTNNPFTGMIYIEGGRLVADHQGNTNKIVDALGTGNVVMSNNSYLELREEGRYDSTITGLGHVDLTSGTETTLTSSASDYTGSTNVLYGTDLTITHVNATGRNASLTDNGGPVNLSADSNLIFDLGDGTHDYFKRIVAADGTGGSVVKKGGNKVVLHNGGNNYQGGTTIEGGELSITHVKAAGTGQVDVKEGANFAVDAAGTFENVVIGGGDVYYNPGNGRDLTVTGINDYTGQTFVETGTVKITDLTGTGRNTATDSGKPVTISGGATLELAEASQGTYYKVLNGEGTLVKSSSMDITLDGRNSHRNTIIQNGRLDINNDQALGTHTTTMRGGTTLGFNDSMTMDGTNNFLLEGNATMDTKVNDVTIETTIGGRGKLTKIGTGTLTLENVDNSFQGGLDINGGKVLVYDQRALGPSSVLNNATLELNLSADATLRTDIFSDNGTFIKSGSKRLDVDHHFITDRFEMTGGTIAVKLDNESYIEAKNGFNISGTSKLVGKYVGSEGIRRGEDNGTLFLALDGTGSDYFSKDRNTAGIENISTDLDALKHISWRTVQQGSKLYYELWAEAYHEVYDLPYNADQAAQGADRLPEDSPLNVALSKLTSEEDLLKAFEQLHGEIKVSAMYAEADMQRNFNEFIFRRSIPCEDCYQFKGFRGQEPRKNSRELWATFTGGGDFRSSFDRFSGYKIGHWGVITGLEQTFAPGFFAGAAIGYDKADMSLKDLPSKDAFYAFRVAAYMNYTYGSWSVNGFAGYSRNWHDMERRIDFLESTAKAKYEDDVTTFGVETRYLIHWNSLDFIPSIGLNYVHIDSPYIQEDGAGPASLHYKRHKYESLRVPIGFRANSRFDLQGIELKPELRMFYVPEMGDKRIRGTTAFSADPSNTFLVDTGVDSRNSFRIGVGSQAKVFERLSLGVDYDAEIWNKFSRHHIVGYLQVRY